jgi:hypothetical protein
VSECALSGWFVSVGFVVPPRSRTLARARSLHISRVTFQEQKEEMLRQQQRAADERLHELHEERTRAENRCERAHACVCACVLLLDRVMPTTATT